MEIFHEDCLKGMRQLQSESVDVVVTSPPYNLGTNYRKYDDNILRKDYISWLETWAIEIKRILSNNGSLFLNIGGKPSDPWGPFEVAGMMRKHYFLQNVIHWIKSIAIEKRQVGNYFGLLSDISVGHFKPINSKRFLNDCQEYIFHFTKNGDTEIDRLSIGIQYQDKSNVNRWSEKGKVLRCRGNTWFVPYKTIWDRNRQRPHPASFPVEIPSMCIKLHGLNRVKTVLDPFLGIGNTAIACRDLSNKFLTDMKFIGYDIDDYYIKYIMEKIPYYTEAKNKMLTIVIKLPKDEADRLRKEVKGSGGFQNLLSKLQQNLTSDNVLKIDLSDIESVIRYCTRYGQGGFQERFPHTLINAMETLVATIQRSIKI